MWMHRSKAEADHGGPVAGKAAIDAAVAAGICEERVIFGGKDKDGKPVRISLIRVKEQKSKASHKVSLSDSQVVAAEVSRADFAAAAASGFEQVSKEKKGVASKANGQKRPAALAIADGTTSEDQASHPETRTVKVMKRPSSASSMVSAGLQEETLAARLGGVM